MNIHIAPQLDTASDGVAVAPRSFQERTLDARVAKYGSAAAWFRAAYPNGGEGEFRGNSEFAS
jgi:hypothetical protein